MKYKLMAIDLDDTLLRDDLTISKRNIDSIRKAVEKGVKVTLASGRATQSVVPYLEQLGLKIPIITYQGARVIDPQDGTILYQREIEPKQVDPLLQYAEKRGIHCNIFIGDVIYIEKMNKWAEYYKNVVGNTISMKEVGRLSIFVDKPITKFIFIDEHDKLQRAKSEVEKMIDENINMFFSKPNYLEFTNKHGTKGAAIQFLGNYFKVKREEIIAIGDSYNDISMIEYAGLGVCMMNGPEEVKKLADYITLSNEEDGVAHVIDKFILS